ncbi:RNA polymerase-binding protein RbpA [Gleimia sp. 6138-11-ORH1]|uniref:RNA polymerase-binding protein RbpA n=1 Tax=Gleimia sp. 6138-11-ORH1 TaxID=2973937 RepID=UPI002167369E|nr:RNA polymerase-binding protein RbpA [Gleimia sp. 6138-11-ORH1]MCS4484349.1 RNA polymerase-binding protein RbpA [Gleimia sp. 6138-11-ORH1]
MADHALRGMQIGSKSLETEEGIVFADRTQKRYQCEIGHVFSITMAAEATAPATWECKCGNQAEFLGTAEPDEEKVHKPVRTHWDMLVERRSIEELEELLQEQLETLRSGELRNGIAYQR